MWSRGTLAACPGLYCAVFVCLLAGNLKSVIGERKVVCAIEDFRLSCAANEVIMMTSAEYGRKEVGRCITEADQYIGCTNDALPLFDRWCSGRRNCEVDIPNRDLEQTNTKCLAILKMYVETNHECINVESTCKSSSANRISKHEGFLSSHVTNNDGCGTSRSPWVISAAPGQTVNITLLDFGATARDENMMTCRSVYGFILERSLGINHTICSGHNREVALYSSKTNTVEIHILKGTHRNSGEFILHYTAVGCRNLAKPPNAWYKREGNEAVIGCETNDQEWRLTCTGNTWHGTVGNCSEQIASVTAQSEEKTHMEVPSLVVLTAIAGGALVAVAIVIVIGVVYVKKHRIRQETKNFQLTCPTLDKHSQACFRSTDHGPAMTLPKVPENMSDSWEMTFPLRMDTNTSTTQPGTCVCGTLPYRPESGHVRSMSDASSANYETPRFVDNFPLTHN